MTSESALFSFRPLKTLFILLRDIADFRMFRGIIVDFGGRLENNEMHLFEAAAQDESNLFVDSMKREMQFLDVEESQSS